jgi:hypothetical protein
MLQMPQKLGGLRDLMHNSGMPHRWCPLEAWGVYYGLGIFSAANLSNWQYLVAFYT